MTHRCEYIISINNMTIIQQLSIYTHMFSVRMSVGLYASSQSTRATHFHINHDEDIRAYAHSP
jgi:hypothetical protein